MKNNFHRIICLVTALFLLSVSNPAAGATVDWIEDYNGPQNGYDSAKKVAVDADGNSYVTGTSGGNTSNRYDPKHDILTIKYDADGVKLWEARYNGPWNAADDGRAITVDLNGNVYVAGGSATSSGKWGFTTIKYDTNGIQQWVARWANQGHWAAWAGDIVVDANGYVYVTGLATRIASRGHDMNTVKYSPNGVQLWSAPYGEVGDDHSTALAVDGNGNVYVTGTIGGRTHSSYYVDRQYGLIKYNSNGQRQWVSRYDGPAHGEDVARDIALDNDGNIYLTGYSDRVAYSGQSQRYFDYATVKFDPNGTQQWAARYNGTGVTTDTDIATSIAVDADKNVSVTGYSKGSGTDYDYTTIRYDASGSEQWVQRYDGPANSTDQAMQLALGSNGNVYVTGESSGSGTGLDYATIKYDNNGVQVWEERHNGLGNGNDSAKSVAVDTAGNVYVTGESDGGVSGIDYVTIKYAQSQTPSAPSTPEEVAALVKDLLESGCITNHGVANAIISSLENAQRKLETNTKSAKNMIEATINKIEAQAGKKLCADEAEKLIEYLQNIIDDI